MKTKCFSLNIYIIFKWLSDKEIKLAIVVSKFKINKTVYTQEGRGHRAVYYTSPQSLLITFSFSLAQQIWGLLLNFDW